MGGSNRDVARAAAAAAADVDGDTVADLQERISVLSAFTGGIVFELDREGRYLNVWTGEPHLLARPAQELIGRTVSEVFGAAEGARFQRLCREVADSGQASAFEYTLDVPAGRRTFSCVARLQDQPSGERGITMLVRDVTDAKALEAKLVHAERLAALGLVAASVGHEIRRPLAYVFTSLDLLERELAALATGATSAEEAVHMRALRDIRTGARRIAEIATRLDVLAARPRTYADLDVRRPLQAALDLCASELSHIDVETAFDEVPLVPGVEGELCQVFANLIQNAAQSLSSSRSRSSDVVPSLHARVSAAPDRASVRVAISDNGPGISPDELERIFDPFFTTKAECGGTGLGLFISRSIVEAHGGELAVTSEPDRATTMVVSIPVTRTSRPPEAPTGIRRVVPEANAPAAARRPLDVLVVDDEPRFVESLRLALEDAHRVQTRTSAAEALELLEADPDRFDVVLCDLSMPGMDGAAFHERMEALGIGDRFVLMTGGAFTPHSAEFMRRRARTSISKPFQLERLLALLDEVTQDRSVS